ncbi:MAG: nucleotide modification associated domain-containing protein [Anaerorhabdus sp.]|uniref:hypothetical protein n=1 Tax=Anaerorhabdus sp. TaxID=1872524 RepID=UPI002FCCB712
MTTYNDLLNRMQETYIAKDADYGNSVDKSLDEFGLIAQVVRMGDKMNRFKKLAGSSNAPQVQDETMVDTLLDLANYAVLTAMWIENKEDLPEGYITREEAVAKINAGMNHGLPISFQKADDAADMLNDTMIKFKDLDEKPNPEEVAINRDELHRCTSVIFREEIYKILDSTEIDYTFDDGFNYHSLKQAYVAFKSNKLTGDEFAKLLDHYSEKPKAMEVVKEIDTKLISGEDLTGFEIDVDKRHGIVNVKFGKNEYAISFATNIDYYLPHVLCKYLNHEPTHADFHIQSIEEAKEVWLDGNVSNKSIEIMLDKYSQE